MGLRTAFFGGGGGGGGGAVTSVFTRTGAVVAALNDYVASLIGNDSSVSGATVKDALNTLLAAIPSVPVSSVFGRTGAVVAALNDYAASLVQNDSGVSGATVKAALDALLALITALQSPPVTTYTCSQTAALVDNGCHILMNVAGGNTYTLPQNSAVAFPIGTLIVVEQYGAGVTAIVQGTGATVLVPPSYDSSLSPNWNFSERYQQVTCKKTGTNEWSVIGGLVLT